MSKITVSRFPDPSEQYSPDNFFELIRVLEGIIQQLNSTYQVDSENKLEAEAWFFSR